MDILLVIHSYLRWLIVIGAVVVKLRYIKAAAPLKDDRSLAVGFSGLMTCKLCLASFLIGMVFRKQASQHFVLNTPLQMIIAA